MKDKRTRRDDISLSLFLKKQNIEPIDRILIYAIGNPQF